jgi:3-oxoacyl-[acyl-carrier-protein] synthase-3
MLPVRISGTGVYAPGEPIDNHELMELAQIQFDAEKTEAKLGYKTRHMARLRGIGESTLDFAQKSALEAIKDAGIDPAQIGLFIVGTDTPEYISPATAVMLQGRIQGGQMPVPAFDIVASCASFTSAFSTAARIMATDASIKYALITGVYNMPAFLRPGDAFGFSIFADGAGSFILERDDSGNSGFIESAFAADGTQWDYIGIYTGGAKRQATCELLAEGKWGLENLQRLPPDRNLRLWPKVVEDLLTRSSLKLQDLDHIIFTQINKSLIVDIMAILGLPMEKTTMVMDRYGYTGSGCIPMAFHHALLDGRIRRGDIVAFMASGSGLSVAANLFKY